MHLPIFSRTYRLLTLIAIVVLLGIALTTLAYLHLRQMSSQANLRILPKQTDEAIQEPDEDVPTSLQSAATEKLPSKPKILIRIFKQEATLEIWRMAVKHYVPLNSYELCSKSLKLGPKLRAGDGLRPEGIYSISKELLRWRWKDQPHRVNLGYPSSYDLARGSTTASVSIHSKCEANHGFALGQIQLQDLIQIIKAALDAGQMSLPVYIYPFKMTWSEMTRHKQHQDYTFWLNLREAYNYFDKHKLMPKVFVCGQRYWITPPGSKTPVHSSSGGSCLPLKAAEDISYQTASKHVWLLTALRSQNLASWASPRMMKKIKVKCNLKRPACKRWLSLRQKMLRKGNLPPKYLDTE